MRDEPERQNPPAPQRRNQLRLRLWIRAVVLLGFIVALGAFLPWVSAPSWIGAFSPYVAVGSILASHTVHALVWLGLLIGLWTTLRRRSFCRWICPTGLVLDGVGGLGRRCGRPAARPGVAGSWLLWITLGGAGLGYPLFLWLDPLAIFSSVFSIPQSAAGWARRYAAVLGLLLLVANFWRPGIWCRQICPLGAFQEAVFRLARAGLGRIRGRPRVGEPPAPTAQGLSRRAWIGATGGALAGVALPRTVFAVPQVVRPPGALPEPMFSGVCLRCGNCLRACPSQIIRNSGPEGGWLGFFTPTLAFDSDYCREDCVRCGEVCPSGALRRIPLSGKPNLRLGHPRVRIELCLLADDRECSHCRNWCPYDAIRYVFSEADYRLEPEVDLDRCNGCGACEAHCPVTPKAIVLEPVT